MVYSESISDPIITHFKMKRDQLLMGPPHPAELLSRFLLVIKFAVLLQQLLRHGSCAGLSTTSGNYCTRDSGPTF
jgi:hypothetical protein